MLIVVLVVVVVVVATVRAVVVLMLLVVLRHCNCMFYVVWLKYPPLKYVCTVSSGG
jgi:hypothetical protein